MEVTNRIQRSELWDKIYNIVKQIPRKEVQGDAMDAPSASTKIEEMFSNQVQAVVKVQIADNIGSWKESMNYAIQHAIEQQEQEYEEDYFLGREEALKYAIKMHDEHFSNLSA